MRNRLSNFCHRHDISAPLYFCSVDHDGYQASVMIDNIYNITRMKPCYIRIDDEYGTISHHGYGDTVNQAEENAARNMMKCLIHYKLTT